MSVIGDAIDAALKAQVVTLCHTLSQSIVEAHGDQEAIDAAKKRFRDGVDHAESVWKIAMEEAGIP